MNETKKKATLPSSLDTQALDTVTKVWTIRIEIQVLAGRAKSGRLRVNGVWRA